MMAKVRIVSLVVGLLLGGLLFHALGMRAGRQNFDLPGLGAETTPVTGEMCDGLIISAYADDSRKIADAVRALQKDAKKVALWVGASQLHAINNYSDGDHLAVVYANRRAEQRESNQRYVQISQANANLNEMLAFYLRLRAEGVRPDWLIVDLTFDDLRERGVRAGLLDGLDAELARTADVGGEGVANLRAEAKEQAGELPAEEAPIERSVLEGTPQDLLEKSLTAWVEQHWPAYANRAKIRAMLEVELRSAAMKAMFARGGESFRIDIPDNTAARNLAALRSMLKIARADGTKVLLYIQPYRPGKDCFWYDRAAYEAFVADMRALADEYGAVFVNLDSLVPADVYGKLDDGRPDVFHFTDAGHRLLGEAIDKTLQQQEKP